MESVYEHCRARGYDTGDPAELVGGFLLLQYPRIGRVLWPVVAAQPYPERQEPAACTGDAAPQHPPPTAMLVNSLLLANAALAEYREHTPTGSAVQAKIAAAQTHHAVNPALAAAAVLLVPADLDAAAHRAVYEALADAYELRDPAAEAARCAAWIAAQSADQLADVEAAVATEGPAILACIRDAWALPRLQQLANVFYPLAEPAPVASK